MIRETALEFDEAKVRQKLQVSFGPDFRIAPDPAKRWIEFTPETSHYVSVPALLNELPIRAVLDTGATRSVISPTTLSVLGLKSVGAINAMFFTTSVKMPIYRLRSLRVGGVAALNLEVGCHKLAMLEHAFPGEHAMLVGRDFLAQAVLECQFPRHRARITSTPAIESDSSYRRLELSHSLCGLPVVPTIVEGRFPEQTLIDLGSNATCTISAEYAQQAGLLDRTVSTTLSAGLEGDVVGRQITLRSLEIGGYELREVPACIIGDWKFDAPINLGWPAFIGFDLAFLFGRELRIRGYEDELSRPLARDRSGIGAQRFTDHLLVRHVSRNSPAEAEGLIAGHRIVAIDGRGIDLDYPVRGQRLGGKRAGSRIQLTLDGGRLINLELRDYF